VFAGAESFDRNLTTWNVGAVVDLSNSTCFFLSFWEYMTGIFSNFFPYSLFLFSVFAGAAAFNCDLSTWNVGAAITTEGMFKNAATFNGDISNWKVQSVTTMKNSTYTVHNLPFLDFFY
jgi:surface protein